MFKLFSRKPKQANKNITQAVGRVAKNKVEVKAQKQQSDDLLMYEESKLEFIEIYGTFISRERKQRIITIILAIITLASMIFAWQIANRVTIERQIVARDKFGLLIPLTYNSESQIIDNHIISAHLGQYIKYIRSLSIDTNVNRDLFSSAYNMTASQLQSKLIDYTVQQRVSLGNNDSSVVNVPISVTITLAQKITPHTWRVTWVESYYGRKINEQTNWSANITFSLFTPTDMATIISNPAGLKILDLDITQVLDAPKG